MLQINGTRNEDVAGFQNAALGLLYFSIEDVRRNRAFVHIEERDVIVGDLVKQNDELHKVGVCLLPEGFLALAEEVVKERSDAVCQRIGVQVVVQGVVAVLGIEADFNVVVRPAVTGQDLLYLMAEIAFHFENES